MFATYFTLYIHFFALSQFYAERTVLLKPNHPIINPCFAYLHNTWTEQSE